MQSYWQLTRKLQKAYNIHNPKAKIVISKQQIYSEEKKSTVDITYIKQYLPGDDGAYSLKPVFRSSSSVDILLCMRDLWFELNGMELPTDNPDWNEKRLKIKRGG